MSNLFFGEMDGGWSGKASWGRCHLRMERSKDVHSGGLKWPVRMHQAVKAQGLPGNDV